MVRRSRRGRNKAPASDEDKPAARGNEAGEADESGDESDDKSSQQPKSSKRRQKTTAVASSKAQPASSAPATRRSRRQPKTQSRSSSPTTTKKQPPAATVSAQPTRRSRRGTGSSAATRESTADEDIADGTDDGDDSHDDADDDDHKDSTDESNAQQKSEVDGSDDVSMASDSGDKGGKKEENERPTRKRQKKTDNSSSRSTRRRGKQSAENSVSTGVAATPDVEKNDGNRDASSKVPAEVVASTKSRVTPRRGRRRKANDISDDASDKEVNDKEQEEDGDNHSEQGSVISKTDDKSPVDDDKEVINTKSSTDDDPSDDDTMKKSKDNSSDGEQRFNDDDSQKASRRSRRRRAQVENDVGDDEEGHDSGSETLSTSKRKRRKIEDGEANEEYPDPEEEKSVIPPSDSPTEVKVDEDEQQDQVSETPGTDLRRGDDSTEADSEPPSTKAGSEQPSMPPSEYHSSRDSRQVPSSDENKSDLEPQDVTRSHDEAPDTLVAELPASALETGPTKEAMSDKPGDHSNESTEKEIQEKPSEEIDEKLSQEKSTDGRKIEMDDSESKDAGPSKAAGEEGSTRSSASAGNRNTEEESQTEQIPTKELSDKDVTTANSDQSAIPDTTDVSTEEPIDDTRKEETGKQKAHDGTQSGADEARHGTVTRKEEVAKGSISGSVMEAEEEGADKKEGISPPGEIVDKNSEERITDTGNSREQKSEPSHETVESPKDPVTSTDVDTSGGLGTTREQHNSTDEVNDCANTEYVERKTDQPGDAFVSPSANSKVHDDEAARVTEVMEDVKPIDNSLAPRTDRIAEVTGDPSLSYSREQDGESVDRESKDSTGEIESADTEVNGRVKQDREEGFAADSMPSSTEKIVPAEPFVAGASVVADQGTSEPPEHQAATTENGNDAMEVDVKDTSDHKGTDNVNGSEILTNVVDDKQMSRQPAVGDRSPRTNNVEESAIDRSRASMPSENEGAYASGPRLSMATESIAGASSPPENTKSENAVVIQSEPSPEKTESVKTEEDVFTTTTPTLPSQGPPKLRLSQKSSLELQTFMANEWMDLKDSDSQHLFDHAKPLETIKTTRWSTLSHMQPSKNVLDVAFGESSVLSNFEESKINKAKSIIFLAGSHVHKGKGFERSFAEYWDALCLRLSGRLSDYVSQRCDEAISTFLKSAKLRRLHNRFVIAIMKRASRSIVSENQADFVPLAWRDKVLVKVADHVSKEDLENDIRNKEMDREFTKIFDEADLSGGSPYKEMWTQSQNNATNKKEVIVKRQLEDPVDLQTAISPRIPGAIAIQPQLTETLERKDMSATENAVWLLSIAVNELTKKVLRDSIGLKQSSEAGRVGVPTLRYPKVLVSAVPLKKRKSQAASARAAMIQAQEAMKKKEKRSITPLDIFAAAQRYPTGQIGSLGGAFSRFSVEHTYQSAFNSLPAIELGQDFVKVQTYVSNQVSSMAADLGSDLNPGRPSPPNQHRQERPGGTTDETNVPPATLQTTSPVAPNQIVASPGPVPGDVAAASSDILAGKSSNLPLQHTGNTEGAGGSLTVTKETPSTSETDKPSNDESASKQALAGNDAQATAKRPERGSVRGMGRGAKDLAALMKRSSVASTTGHSVGNRPTDLNTAETTNNPVPVTQDGSVVQSQEDTKRPVDANDKSETVATPGQSESGKTATSTESQSPASSTGPPRRGKGMGAKNLAAMLARSKSGGVTNPSSDSSQRVSGTEAVVATVTATTKEGPGGENSAEGSSSSGELSSEKEPQDTANVVGEEEGDVKPTQDDGQTEEASEPKQSSDPKVENENSSSPPNDDSTTPPATNASSHTTVVSTNEIVKNQQSTDEETKDDGNADVNSNTNNDANSDTNNTATKDEKQPNENETESGTNGS